ncbi:hypothetical protein HZS_1700 [Henneguya salminicola]|nr:hypothetical protein HZS_1700 [Henneguya salminicola]
MSEKIFKFPPKLPCVILRMHQLIPLSNVYDATFKRKTLSYRSLKPIIVHGIINKSDRADNEISLNNNKFKASPKKVLCPVDFQIDTIHMRTNKQNNMYVYNQINLIYGTM